MGRPCLVTPFAALRASSERSEGSVATGAEMLHCAQHDSAATNDASPGCHPEPFAAAQGKLREGSVATGAEMLRCAQHDSAVTHTDGWNILFMCIIGPNECPDSFVKVYKNIVSISQ